MVITWYKKVRARSDVSVMYIFLITLCISIGVLVSPVSAAPTGGLVPCGSNKSGTAQDACTICDLIEGVHGIVQKLMSWMVIAGLVIITVAGIIYIVSAGNQGLTTMAKNAVINTLIGITVILTAFLGITFILNRVFNAKTDMIAAGGLSIANNAWTFTCSKTKAIDTGGGGGVSTGGGTPTPPSQGGTPPATPPAPQPGNQPLARMTNAEAKQYLIDQTGGNITIWESAAGRTYVPDLQQSSIDGIVNLQKESGLRFQITGAAEKGGGHASGTYSHANGYKVDISDKNPALNSYITSNYQEIGKRSDGARQFRDPQGNVYAWETWKNHWDVCYACKK